MYAGLIGEWEALSQQTDRPAGEDAGQPNAAANEADAQAARANAEVGEGEIGEETIQLREGAGGSQAVKRAQQRVQQRRAISARSVRRRMLDRNARSNPRWASDMVDALRRGEENDRVDYENFDYLAAVERLRPGIETTIKGDGRRPGLEQIMDRRRQGDTDAQRRPRKRRSGETGNIDLQRPERLLTDPLNAFLKGLRVPRNDRQRDFASLILLDISGSMVQKGYPTRKFDRLADSAILFIEIHERLRIPFEVIAFSSQITPLWAFADCKWPRQLSGRAAPYEPRDHSEIFKRLYDLDHKDTDDSGALAAALERSRSQPGLKSIFVVTDGISSDPALLRRALIDMHRNNRAGRPDQRYKVLAFGVGVVKSEFQLAYQPTYNDKPPGILRRGGDRRCCGVAQHHKDRGRKNAFGTSRPPDRTVRKLPAGSPIIRFERRLFTGFWGRSLILDRISKNRPTHRTTHTWRRQLQSGVTYARLRRTPTTKHSPAWAICSTTGSMK